MVGGVMGMIAESLWQVRSPSRLPDGAWHAAVDRIRAEFAEMPCLRVTVPEACRLFGLTDPMASWVLGRLTRDGFLTVTPRGEYMRRADNP